MVMKDYYCFTRLILQRKVAGAAWCKIQHCEYEYYFDRDKIEIIGDFCDTVFELLHLKSCIKAK